MRTRLNQLEVVTNNIVSPIVLKLDNLLNTAALNKVDQFPAQPINDAQ